MPRQVRIDPKTGISHMWMWLPPKPGLHGGIHLRTECKDSSLDHEKSWPAVKGQAPTCANCRAAIEEGFNRLHPPCPSELYCEYCDEKGRRVK